jgi:5-formyltetrahydrofolate cyclo-ligase
MAGGARLEFAPVERWDELVAGRYGVLEPPEALGRVELRAGDAVIVPGVAFDEAGHRLGRGMGYYDRTFSGAGGPLLVGLAYEFQVRSSVPFGERDRGMDVILTERRVRCIGRGTP